MKAIAIIIISVGIMFTSCSEFLEKKPNIKLVVPKSLKDAELLLNDYNTMNTGFPIWGEICSDDYYLTEESWTAILDIDHRNAYVWLDEPYVDATQWQTAYKKVYVANQIFSVLEGHVGEKNTEQYKKIYGSALFFRSFALHQLLEVFAPTYSAATSATEMGIPLREDPNIGEVSVRSSIKDCYDKVIADYKTAIRNLPVQEVIPGRPHRAAAYAGLSRAYLDMGNYDQAYLYADSCLQLKPDLMDFNNLDRSEELPIPRFNPEVLFSAISTFTSSKGFYIALVDSTLYKRYDDEDLRKYIFFQDNSVPEGSYLFKGNYDNNTSQLFVGLTTSEVYLIKAETGMRIGKVQEGLAALNTLLKKRWEVNKFTEILPGDPQELLKLILTERQKELLFRGRRWADLKRLNLDTRFQKTLVRKIGGKEYRLEPNSKKYAFRLPETVVDLGKIPQNLR
ncbi:RagB/SusD family nutrient uptake outer membrane protein [Sphingobacterium sp. SG20118]|uniref:RagB/SusD family nutrient uptake outer membrane protein n=1 Tax=Sphingobacterium sp. SG20118 TaxID=3367156 RepID=UPI0037DFBF1D